MILYLYTETHYLMFLFFKLYINIDHLFLLIESALSFFTIRQSNTSANFPLCASVAIQFTIDVLH